jgi:serine/threonine protein kinase/predicted Zn-dependent protease
MTITAGKVLGKRYQILSELGVGGFGRTFLAVDLHLPKDNRCVVKQLQPDSDDPFTLETARRLFAKEAEILQQLGNHPQIPQLFAYFEEDRQFYLVQEYIAGHELASELTYHDGQQIIRQQYNDRQTITLLQEILEILQFVHQNNVVHRDLNPHNLIRRHSDNKLVLIDFGAVKQITTQILSHYRQNNSKRVTVSIGTSGYLPSEQANGNPRFSSDLYAVGIIGIRALTGALVEELQIDPQTGEIDWQNLGNNSQLIPKDLQQFLDRSIRYDYRQRYPSAMEALEVIKQCQNRLNQGRSTGLWQRHNNHTQTNQTLVVPQQQRSVSGLKNRILQGSIVAFILVLSIAGYSIFNSLRQEQNLQQLYRQANTLYDLKRYREAFDFYEKALAIRPDFGDAIRGKADTLRQLNRDRDALINYEKAIQINNEDWDAWLGRSRILLKLGKEKEALYSLNFITANEPGNYAAWGELAQIYLKNNQYAEALDPLARSIRANRDDASLRYQKGWALYNLKKYDEARKAFDEVIDIKFNHSQAWYQKGNCFVQLKKYNNALEAYDKAVTFDPQYFSAWYSKATILKTMNKYEEALQAYEKTISIRSNFWQAWYDRGWILHQLKQYNLAITSFDRALKLQPNNHLIWYNRGNSAYNLGEYQLAITSYQKTVTLRQDFSIARASLGNAYLNNQQYSEAIATFDRVLKDSPNNQQAIQGKERARVLLDRTQEQEMVEENEEN